jgi:hypothetical protein
MTGEHPRWCSVARCGIGGGHGRHESEPLRVPAKGRTPRITAALTQTVNGPVRVHLIMVGDLIVNDLSITLDTAHMFVAALTQLIEMTQPNG